MASGGWQSEQYLHGEISPRELIDRLGQFQGHPAEFLVNLLAVQCHLSGAASGAILRPAENGQVDVVAVFPLLAEGTSTLPYWLARAAESIS